ncbi:MAG: alginate export family protein [Pseudomonadota bacterium]
MRKTTVLLMSIYAAGAAIPAFAEDGASEVELKPIIDIRARYEGVDQDNALRDADAVTARIRAGLEVKVSDFSFLAEGEGTLAVIDNYNSTTNGNAGIFSVVADPENIELNRLQLQYAGISKTKVTVGRQRINIGDQRFVGAVAWRQNEQTFDALRVQSSALGPVSVDASYIISQRTIFGVDAGPRQSFDMDTFLVDLGLNLGPVKLTGFAHFIDQDQPARFAFASKTFGIRAVGKFNLGKAKLTAKASYANQSDYQTNPADYDVDYIAVELAGAASGFGAKVGYEELGADGAGNRFQTPFATLHKFNGWADLFLSTPATGLRDYYGGVSYAPGNIGPFKGVKTQLVYHKFEADVGGADYGDEINASLGFKLGKVGVLFKYADFNSDGFAVDTTKFWLQFGWKY